MERAELLPLDGTALYLDTCSRSGRHLHLIGERQQHEFDLEHRSMWSQPADIVPDQPPAAAPTRLQKTEFGQYSPCSQLFCCTRWTWKDLGDSTECSETLLVLQVCDGDLVGSRCLSRRANCCCAWNDVDMHWSKCREGFRFVCSPQGAARMLLCGTDDSGLLICTPQCQILCRLSLHGRVSYSPSGRQLFVWYCHGGAFALSTASWQREEPELPLQQPGWVLVDMGSTAALYQQEGMHWLLDLALVNFQQGQTPRLMPLQTGPVERLELASFSPCERWLALGSLVEQLPRLAFVSAMTGAVLRTWSPRPRQT